MPEFIKKNLWGLLLLVCPFVSAQPLPDPTRDMTAVPVAYEPLREADAAFQWTLERIIDTREKQNLALNWPQNNLRTLVYQAVLTGQVPAYKNNEFKDIYADTTLMRLGEYCHYINIPCADNPDDVCDSFVCEPVELERMVKWKIVEEWIFDKEQSRMIPRIVGLALMYRPIAAGIELPETPLFWVKYDDLRPQLAQNRILNAHNERASVSFDHFFQARLFSSYVTKYPNPHDYQISEMEEFADNPVAALYESEKTRLKLFETEHDLWEY
jgi:gliding motility associated protien GldN